MIGIFFNFANMRIDEISESAGIYQRLSKGVIDHDKYTYYSITHHSTAIEGSTLTEKQTVNLLEYGRTAGNKPIEHHLMVLDYYQALDFVIRAGRELKPVTVQFIQAIASKVKMHTGETINTILGSYETDKGDFRLSGVRAGNRLFPDYKKVPEMIRQLCDSTNVEIKKVKTFEEKTNLAFKLHYDFVSIHPFGDGNGRTSRLLMNFIQSGFNLPLSIVFKQDRMKYINALENARSGEDITLFYKFMYDQYAKFLKKEIEILREKE